MKIVRGDRARRARIGREHRTYYDADLLRVVITELPAGHAQLRHWHEQLSEACLVLEGQIEASEDGSRDVQLASLNVGDLAVFGPGRVHGVTNRSVVTAKMLTFKFAPDSRLTSEEFQSLCESDWHSAS